MVLKLFKEMFGVLACGHFFIFIVTLQCWTAALSSPPFKLFYWSISSCVGSSLATRPPHYKRYVASARRGRVSKLFVCDGWRFVQTLGSLKRSVYGAYHKTNLCARESEHWLFCSDLAGVSALPTVPEALHQPCRSAPHTPSEYLQLN